MEVGVHEIRICCTIKQPEGDTKQIHGQSKLLERNASHHKKMQNDNKETQNNHKETRKPPERCKTVPTTSDASLNLGVLCKSYIQYK